MKISKVQLALILIGALVLGFAGAYIGVSIANPDQADQIVENNNNDPIRNNDNNSQEDEGSNNNEPPQWAKVSQAYNLIKDNYLEEVDEQQLIEGAIEGMLQTLGDPYSSYMDIETMKNFNEQIESSFEGIGAEVSMVNGIVTIVAPIKNSPAEKAGIRPNDQVLEVDGESLEGYNLNEAVSIIRGEKGTEVILTIQRQGTSEPFEVSIIRDTIPIETVYSEMHTIDGKKTGVIEITNFSETTSKEFNNQLKDLEDDGMEGLIIDVRGNPGGLLSAVEEVLMNFIPKDIPYIQIEDADGNKSPYYSKLNEKKDYPITVLIDEGSASASEILAVAMKEIGYQIIGKTSFGKGTVQQAVPLGDGSTIKLTFFKWLSPEGNWIHEKGVEPTTEVEQPKYYYTNPVQIEDPLKFNDTGNQVENIQVMLDGLGYDVDRTDGYFSEKTEEAVKQFQQDNDLSATGVVDQDTAGTLEGKVIERIRSGEDDIQLEKALEEIYK
ncbi:S41 family peptidase [Ornithinibacillus halotolerans]|uniref:C-terminal processing peptidase n=1 Tax=Ornithinibacillus halotolerans TaxID=1274357 RepID=A0A916W581_9BACI|nr:S41 family peptidase [Ornithinibacillus halotolerans]GGA67277.1 peptidase S41 [Ornithinibacillus halotolerans]